MATKEYNIAAQELDKMIDLERKLSETNTKLIEGNEVLESLALTIRKTQESLVPALRLYLKDIINIRMSIGREIQDILQSSRNLKELSKISDDITKFAASVETLRIVMEKPSTIEMMEKLVK